MAFITEKVKADLEKALGANAHSEPCTLPTSGFGAMVSSFVPSGLMHHDSDGLAWLFYTSGTKGRPKDVEITHGMMQAMALNYFVDVDKVSDTDNVLYAAPMSHGAGLYNLVHVLKDAAYVCPIWGSFDPQEIF